MRVYEVGRRCLARLAGVITLCTTLLAVLLLDPRVSQAQLEERVSDSGILSAQIAAALLVAMTDYQRLNKHWDRGYSAPELATRVHGVLYRKKGDEVEVDIFEGRTPLTFGGGVHYTIDLKDYRIVRRRFGR